MFSEIWNIMIFRTKARGQILEAYVLLFYCARRMVLPCYKITAFDDFVSQVFCTERYLMYMTGLYKMGALFGGTTCGQLISSWTWAGIPNFLEPWKELQMCTQIPFHYSCDLLVGCPSLPASVWCIITQVTTDSWKQNSQNCMTLWFSHYWFRLFCSMIPALPVHQASLWPQRLRGA